MKTVFITGIAGFLGRYTAREFARQGWRVCGADVVPPENAPHGPELVYRQIGLPSADFSQWLRLENPQVCVHCAGRASVPLSMEDPSSDFRDNALLTFEVLDALRRESPRCRFLFLSSAAVYGNPELLPVAENHRVAPLSPYGYHKRQGELLCEEFFTIFGIPTAAIRLFSAYGPGLRRQVVWDICERALLSGQLLLRGTGNESRDFIHAADVARALAHLAVHAPAQGEIYNVSSGREVTIAELARLLLKQLGKAIEPQFDGKSAPGQPLNWRADVSRMAALGFEPTMPLEDGLRGVANWCQAELSNA